MKKLLLLLLGLATAGLVWRRTQTRVPADLNGKVVLITGASAGIGRAVSHVFAAHGASVVLVARRTDILYQVKQELAHYGHPVLMITADVTREDDIARVVATTVSQCGRIDVLVNNAGLAMGGWFDAADPDQMSKLLNLNVVGLMRLTQQVLPYMIKQRDGYIVNISSTASFTNAPGQAIYAASKAAVNAFSNALRREYRSKGIHVSLVMPGWTRTEMTNHMNEQKMYDAKLLGVGMVMDQVETVAQGIVDTVCFNRPFAVYGGALFKFSSLAFIGHAYVADWSFRYLFKSDTITDVMNELGSHL